MILTSANNITNNVLSNTITSEERKVLPKEITGPGTIYSATDAVYEMVSYNYREGSSFPAEPYSPEQTIDWDADKDNIGWVF